MLSQQFFMQKNTISPFIAAFVIVTVIALVIIADYSYRYIHNASAPVPAPVRQHMVLTVDFNGDNALNEKELVLGEDAVLAIRVPNKNGTKDDQIFNSLDALKQFDTNKDLRLDRNDPVFTRLELAFFSEGGKKRQYLSIDKAHIVAIEFLPQSLTLTAKDKEVASKLVGYAIKEKGQKIQIRLIPIDLP